MATLSPASARARLCRPRRRQPDGFVEGTELIAGGRVQKNRPIRPIDRWSRTLRQAVLFASLLIVAACASTTTAHIPEARDPLRAATVTVYRTGDLFGSAGRLDIQFDGFTIAKLAPNTHVRFSVDPGQYSVGTNQAQTMIAFAPGEAYVFQVDLDMNGNHSVARIPLDEWEERQKRSTLVQ